MARWKFALLAWALVALIFVARGAAQEPADVVEPVPPEPAATTPAATTPAEATPDAPPQEDYYELFKLFADTLDQVERNYVHGISRRELMEAAIHGVLQKLDPYSNYISPEEVEGFRTSVESQFGGIGLQVTIDAGRLKVISPIVGTPAYRTGVHAGDFITHIDGQTTEGLNVDECVGRLKGEAGSTVSITFVPGSGGEPKTAVITREIIHVETVLGDRRKPDDSWDFMLDHERRIGYIRLTSFSRNTSRELAEALEQLKQENLSGLVLDLRFNPGGLLGSAIEISDLFVEEGRIVSTRGRDGVDLQKAEAHKDGTFSGFPMAVLVNRYSASASEVVAACLQDHQRAVIVGERTWGKGSVQNVIDLEGGKSALKLTTASYHRPSGKNIHRAPDAKEEDEWGVMPDEGYREKLGDDEQLELMRFRRERDIVIFRAEGQPEVPAAPEEAPKEEVATAGPFVDRQLQKALEYIAGQAMMVEAPPAAGS